MLSRFAKLTSAVVFKNASSSTIFFSFSQFAKVPKYFYCRPDVRTPLVRRSPSASITPIRCFLDHLQSTMTRLLQGGNLHSSKTTELTFNSSGGEKEKDKSTTERCPRPLKWQHRGLNFQQFPTAKQRFSLLSAFIMSNLIFDSQLPVSGGVLVPWFTTPVGSGIIPIYHGTKVLQRDYQLQSYGTLLTVQILCIPSWYNISIQPLGIWDYTVAQDHFPYINPTISNWYRTNLNLSNFKFLRFESTSSSCDSNPSKILFCSF